MADALLIVGFALIVVGVGLWSIPASLVVSGVVLFLAGGAMRRGDDA